MAPPRQHDPATSDADPADAILDDMRSTGRPVTPLQFEFWYHYKTGLIPALNAAADDIMATRGAIAGEEIERLHQRFLSPWRLSDGCAAVTDRLSEKLQDLSACLGETIDSVAAERDSVVAEACDLGACGGATLRRAIQSVDRLVQSAEDGKTRHAILEAKLDATKREIGALRRQLDVVRVESLADPLTSLMSRASYDQALAKAADRASREGGPLALIVLDIDYFASFNENFGRQAADQALRSVGLLVKAHMRPGDIVARLGDDEFAAILPGAKIEEAVKLADRVRQMLMSSEIATSSNNPSGRLTVSAGAAAYVSGDRAKDLLERAKAGLRVAKMEGRNRAVEMKPDGPVWAASRIA
jgi:diguanylate cyclase